MKYADSLSNFTIHYTLESTTLALENCPTAGLWLLASSVSVIVCVCKDVCMCRDGYVCGVLPVRLQDMEEAQAS